MENARYLLSTKERIIYLIREGETYLQIIQIKEGGSEHEYQTTLSKKTFEIFSMAAENLEALTPSKEHQEDERKFLVDKNQIPFDLIMAKKSSISHFYIAATGDLAIRLRKKDNKYFQTIKKGTGQKRAEYEVGDLNETAYKTFLPAKIGHEIKKTRHFINHEGWAMELDIFEGDLEGLILIEVESDTHQKCDAFNPPGWMSEVTHDLRFTNASLAINGLPQPFKAEVKSH